MAESKLRTLSIDFAVQILNLVKFLKSQHETIVSNQISRAGTRIKWCHSMQITFYHSFAIKLFSFAGLPVVSGILRTFLFD